MERLAAYKDTLAAYVKKRSVRTQCDLPVARILPQAQTRARKRESKSVDDPDLTLWTVKEIFGCDLTSLMQQPQLPRVEVDVAAQTYISSSQQDVVHAIATSPDGNCFFKYVSARHNVIGAHDVQPVANESITISPTVLPASSLSILLFGNESRHFELRIWAATLGYALPVDWWRQWVFRHLSVSLLRICQAW